MMIKPVRCQNTPWLSGSVATGRGADVPTGLDVYMTALITGMDAMDGIAGTPHTNFHIFNNVKRKGCQFLTPSFQYMRLLIV